MNAFRVVLGLLVACMLTAALTAQEGQKGSEAPAAEPTASAAVEQHELLKRFVGKWATTAKATPGPGQPEFECSGETTARMLGEFWVVSEITTHFGEGRMRAIQTIGYDPRTSKYIGTWVDSMINHLWRYEGEVDETGQVLTLEAEGPNHLSGGKTTRFRDVYEFRSADHIVSRSQMRGDDGQWVTFATGELRRQGE